MSPPVQAMPSRYAIRLEAVTKIIKISMAEAADQLHMKVDSEPSPEPKVSMFRSVLIAPGRPGVSTPI